MFEFDCSEAFVQILKQLTVFLPCQECVNQRFLFLLERDEFLQLLLLQLIANKLHILAEISYLGDFLLLSLSQLHVDTLNIFFHFLFRLQKTASTSTLFITLCHLLVSLSGQLWLRGFEVTPVEEKRFRG